MSQEDIPTNGQAVTTKKFFSHQTDIAIDIAAPAEKIWQILIDSENMKNWNSTIVSFQGKIALGEKIELCSTLDPKRVFKLKVKAFEPQKRLSWGDSMGTRTYILASNDDGKTRFSMTERIGGPFFPLFSAMLPSFDESFNQIAQDLKKAAEQT